MKTQFRICKNPHCNKPFYRNPDWTYTTWRTKRYCNHGCKVQSQVEIRPKPDKFLLMKLSPKPFNNRFIY